MDDVPVLAAALAVIAVAVGAIKWRHGADGGAANTCGAESLLKLPESVDATGIRVEHSTASSACSALAWVAIATG